MHQNNNNIDAASLRPASTATAAHRAKPAHAAAPRVVYSESMAAAIDDLRGSSTSRRSGLKNALK